MHHAKIMQFVPDTSFSLGRPGCSICSNLYQSSFCILLLESELTASPQAFLDLIFLAALYPAGCQQQSTPHFPSATTYADPQTPIHLFTPWRPYTTGAHRAISFFFGGCDAGSPSTRPCPHAPSVTAQPPGFAVRPPAEHGCHACILDEHGCPQLGRGVPGRAHASLPPASGF